ncbi:hypothetical protein predicted by Glimmer/Critica [Sorangium cellulosum So ce56]|uniref:Uncharacterized protein n=1 Tax=Sorangium cellulosum (strain So ce56) TaxID=448385 RepID=A9GDH2_SORC5|nr:hypothetical protein predicted by Glimmer/Critica [Sorangium cellulosum So ce56]
MLNAFRHHGGDRQVEGSLPSGFTGAQRLPASRRGSRDDPVIVGTAEDVLNAFRHHGGDRVASVRGLVRRGMCSTPSGITAGIARRGAHLRAAARGVLNAFRHHGGDRFFDARTRTALLPVLNAFRHHGGDRRCGAICAASSSVCSTPSGITAGIARATRIASYRW